MQEQKTSLYKFYMSVICLPLCLTYVQMMLDSLVSTEQLCQRHLSMCFNMTSLLILTPY